MNNILINEILKAMSDLNSFFCSEIDMAAQFTKELNKSQVPTRKSKGRKKCRNLDTPKWSEIEGMVTSEIAKRTTAFIDRTIFSLVDDW